MSAAAHSASRTCTLAAAARRTRRGGHCGKLKKYQGCDPFFLPLYYITNRRRVQQNNTRLRHKPRRERKFAELQEHKLRNSLKAPPPSWQKRRSWVFPCPSGRRRASARRRKDGGERQGAHERGERFLPPRHGRKQKGSDPAGRPAKTPPRAGRERGCI